MRDYPTVPNVFRVASSHSVDTDCATVATVSANGCDIKITSGTNANLPTGQLRQQQKPPNGNISGQQQSLVKSFISSQTTTTTTTALPTTAANTKSSTLSPTTILKSSTSQQQQPSKNDVDFIMHNHNSLHRQQQQKQHQHKLTTHASIEQPHCLRTSQLYLHHSPYATLPRNIAASQSTLSLLSPTSNTVSTEGDLSKQQQHEKQQYNHNSTNNSNNNDNGNGNGISSNEPTMLGVINTISGSIPATGYTMDPLTTTKANVNTSGGGAIAHRTISMGSNLNMAMNNSCTNLSKLNGIQQQQQHQQQQQKNLRLQQQKQSTHHQSDFKQLPTTATTIDDFTTYRRQYPCSSLERNTNGYLWIITPVAASISVAIVIAALAGPQWLFTEEKLPNTLYNGTANFNVLDDGAFITRYTKSSLWIICTTLQGVETYSCIKIDYFSEKGYQPDPHDSASAIPYTVTKSCPFFLASGIVLLLSFIVFLIPTCSHQNNLYYFSAGIMFIVSGLLMLIGLIAYISILKAEIGSKLRPRSTLQPPLFKVTYGQSFFLFVFGFIATEFVGVLNIFLYISLQEVGYYSRLPCFTISNLQEKIKEGENRLNTHTYKSYKHEIESKKPIDRKRNQQNRKHQVVAQELELNSKNLLKNMTQANGKRGVAGAVAGRKVIDASTEANAGPYACRKHPNGLASTMLLNELDRRYYFEKPSTSNSTQSKCNLHSKNLAKSLNELYTEAMTSSAFLPPPPPPSAVRASMQLQTHTLPRPPQQFSDSPQGFPLTRSVSTTTDIYASQNVTFSKSATRKANNGEGGGGSRRRNAATNTRCKTDNETQTNGGGGQQSNNIANSKKIQQQQLQQQQQKNNQLHNNIYKANYATSYANNDGDNDLVGEFIDKHHQRRHQRTAVDAKNAHNDGNHRHNNNTNNNENNKSNVEDDDNDVDDEVQPQKLCGLKRSIRKTKDELFEEFCKRAGVRPKPKNIYYIENRDDDDNDDDDNGNNVDYGNDDDDDDDNNDDDDGVVDNTLATASVEDNSTHLSNEIENVMQRKPQRLNNSLRRGIANSHTMHSDVLENQHQLQQHAGEFRGTENNRLYSDAAVDVVDIDEDVDENGFKKLTENEDHLYVIDDNIHLMPQLTRNGRRASMFVEPNHLRRLNSNLSLHAIYAPATSRTGLQKSLYDLETTGNEFDFIAAQQQHHQPHYIIRDTYGGSQQRLHQDYHQHVGYQSRTLPRAYLKRNADSQDSVTAIGLNTSSTQLHNMYSASQQRLSTLAMQHQQHQQQQQQQQQRHQNRYISMSREEELYNSRYALHKSNEELNRHYMQQQQQQQPIYIQTQHQLQQYQQQQQQHHVNGASTNYGTTTTLKPAPPLVQWPAAIPSSPSNFSGSFHMFGPASNGETQNSNTNHHPLLTRSSSNNTSTAAGGHLLNGSSSGSQGPPKFQRAYAFDEQRRTSAVLTDAFDLDEIERERRRSHASLFSGLGINATTVNSKASVMGGTVGVGSSKNQDHYDMINGTAV